MGRDGTEERGFRALLQKKWLKKIPKLGKVEERPKESVKGELRGEWGGTHTMPMTRIQPLWDIRVYKAISHAVCTVRQREPVRVQGMAEQEMG